MPSIGAKDLHLGLRRRGERQMQEEQMQILHPKIGALNDGAGLNEQLREAGRFLPPQARVYTANPVGITGAGLMVRCSRARSTSPARTEFQWVSSTFAGQWPDTTSRRNRDVRVA
jgi:hypothetical protein